MYVYLYIILLHARIVHVHAGSHRVHVYMYRVRCTLLGDLCYDIQFVHDVMYAQCI